MPSNENVEIITRPDGKKVRRIRKTKPNPPDKSNQLAGFLESQPKTPHRGGAATVSGASFNQTDKKNIDNNTKDAPKLKREKSLGSLLGNMDSKPRKMGSASVAGDQVAVTKESSLTGEVYIREDGKKGKILFRCLSFHFVFSRTIRFILVLFSSTCQEKYPGSTRRPG